MGFPIHEFSSVAVLKHLKIQGAMERAGWKGTTKKTSPLMVSLAASIARPMVLGPRNLRERVGTWWLGGKLGLEHFGAVVYVMSTGHYIYTHTYIYICEITDQRPIQVSYVGDLSKIHQNSPIFSKFLSWKPRHRGIYRGHLLRCHGTAVADSHAVAAADARGGGPFGQRS